MKISHACRTKLLILLIVFIWIIMFCRFYEDLTVLNAVSLQLKNEFFTYNLIQALIAFYYVDSTNKETQKWHRLATKDELTGAYSRRFFGEVLNKQFTRYLRHNNTTSSVLMLDVDHFKRINDVYGHAVGDAVLQHISFLLQQHIRSSDIFARLGGEEFAILLIHTTIEHAQEDAERLCNIIATESLNLNGVTIGCSVSIGVTCFIPGDTSESTLLKRADEAMYEAKSKGRNRAISRLEPGFQSTVQVV